MSHQEKQTKEVNMEEIEAVDTVEDVDMDIDNSDEESDEEDGDRARAEAKIIFKASLNNLREPQFSPTFYVRDLPWQIKLERRLTRNPRTLGFYLRCNGVPQPSTWSCFAAAEMRLLKRWSKPCIYSESVDGIFSRKIRHVYQADENEAGFTAFISWEDLCDPRRGFLVDNTIEVQVNVKADVPHIEQGVEPSVNIQEQEVSPEITYYFELPKVSEFRGQHLSRNFNIHNIPFQLMLQTIPEEEPTALGFFLICLGDPKHTSWSCYVEAELRLMSQDANGEACTRTFKHLFHKDETQCGFRRFISWKYFLDSKKGFVKNDTARFEIEVRADASAVSELLVDRSNHNRARKEAKMRCTVYNISQLKTTLFASPFYVRNLPWRIKVMQRTCIGPIRQIQKYLSVYLQCDEESEAWSCNAIAILTLLKHDGEEFGRGLHYLFCKKKNHSGFSHFIPWDQVLDPKSGFIKNDSITLLAYLKGEEPCGINCDLNIGTNQKN